MEKKLLYSAIALFTLELVIFLADLGYLPTPIFESNEVQTRQPMIGFVRKTRETVRKKSHESIFWQPTSNKDTLNAYDSILTLENSAAELELENDIQLNLNGNTLVVLEPVEAQGQKRFRIQFQKGNLRTLSSKQDVTMKTSDWILEANKGTDISVTQMKDQHIQVEVLKGQARISHTEVKKNSTIISSGSRVALSKQHVKSAVKISKDFEWITNNNQMVKYDYQFPTPVTLSWKGRATRLRLLQPGQNFINKKLRTDRHGTWTGQFEPGTWLITAETNTSTSPTLMLKVLPTKKPRYLSPLPRDRHDATTTTLFDWLKHPDIDEYELQISDTSDFSNILETYKTKDTHLDIFLKSSGLIYWRLQGNDHRGYQVPAFYIYPLYNVKTPLDPPQLRPPLQRQPAQKKQKKGTSLLKKFYQKQSVLGIIDWLLPTAHAKNTPSPSPEKTKKTIIFSWYEVPEADYYVIEISVSKDFLNPLLVKKVTQTEFSWSEFDINTYYYRVAAAQNNGRMGLFSTPEEVNLNLLDTETASKELKPGVRLSIEKIKNKIKKQQKEDTTELEKKTTKPKNIVVRSVLKVEKPVALKRHEMNITGSLFWSGGYIINSHSTKNSVKAHQSGFSVRRLGLNLTLPMHKYGHLSLHSEYNENKWQSDTDKLPFQNSLIQTHWFHSLMYASQNSPSPYGLFYESIGIAERSGSESMSLKNIEIYGLLTKTRYQFFSSWNTQHTLGMGYGPPFFVLHSDNYVFYGLNFWGEHTGNTGLEFNIKYGQGSSGLNFIYSQIMYRIGFEF